MPVCRTCDARRAMRDAITAVAPQSLLIALIGLLESVSVAKSIALRCKYDIDANQVRAAAAGGGGASERSRTAFRCAGDVRPRVCERFCLLLWRVSHDGRVFVSLATL